MRTTRRRPARHQRRHDVLGRDRDRLARHDHSDHGVGAAQGRRRSGRHRRPGAFFVPSARRRRPPRRGCDAPGSRHRITRSRHRRPRRPAVTVPRSGCVRQPAYARLSHAVAPRADRLAVTPPPRGLHHLRRRRACGRLARPRVPPAARRLHLGMRPSAARAAGTRRLAGRRGRRRQLRRRACRLYRARRRAHAPSPGTRLPALVHGGVGVLSTFTCTPTWQANADHG